MKNPGKENLSWKEFEANENLTGFFRLLLEVDRRINPQNHKGAIANNKEMPPFSREDGND